MDREGESSLFWPNFGPNWGGPGRPLAPFFVAPMLNSILVINNIKDLIFTFFDSVIWPFCLRILSIICVFDVMSHDEQQGISTTI